jgi:hypothetical protein
MAKHTELPPVVVQHAPDAAIPHLPTPLPPSPVTPPSIEVTPEQHALDAVEEHVALLGAAPHLPNFFGLG